MAEWLKAAVLKTVSRQRDVGSNPTPSARKFTKGSIILFAINNAFTPKGAIRCQAVLVTDCLNVNYYMLPLVTWLNFTIGRYLVAGRFLHYNTFGTSSLFSQQAQDLML